MAKIKIFVRAGILFLAFLFLPGHGVTSSGSEEFCNIANTSREGRSQEEVDEYYQKLEAAAPEEIQGDVAILGAGWNIANFSLEEAMSGDIRNIQRPTEVSASALNVFEYVREMCGFDGGVYLIFPEMGL